MFRQEIDVKRPQLWDYTEGIDGIVLSHATILGGAAREC